MSINETKEFYKKLIENFNGILIQNNHYYLIRVFYEDTDAGGIVYHSNYLNYFERARTSLLNFFNFNQKKLYDNKGLSFVVRQVNLQITNSFHLNDFIIIQSRLKYAKNSSITLEQLAWSIDKDFKLDVLSVKGSIQIVMIDKKNKVRKINNILTNSFFNKQK